MLDRSWRKIVSDVRFGEYLWEFVSRLCFSFSQTRRVVKRVFQESFGIRCLTVFLSSFCCWYISMESNGRNIRGKIISKSHHFYNIIESLWRDKDLRIRRKKRKVSIATLITLANKGTKLTKLIIYPFPPAYFPFLFKGTMKEQNIPSTWQKKFRVNTWTKIHRRRIPSFRLLEPRKKKKRKKKEKEKEKKKNASSHPRLLSLLPFLSSPFFFPRRGETAKNARALFPRHRFFPFLSFFSLLYRRFILESHPAGRMQANKQASN